jgi:hypothetical protein
MKVRWEVSNVSRHITVSQKHEIVEARYFRAYKVFSLAWAESAQVLYSRKPAAEKNFRGDFIGNRLAFRFQVCQE